MNNPFQEQLLKAGLVSKQQVQKVKQEKSKKNKQQRSKKDPVIDENKLKLQQAAELKASHDRELNRKKQEQARKKAISTEIDQLISNNKIPRDESCEITYNFEHNGKIKRIYVDEAMKKQIIKGKLGIARIEGRYELVALAVVEKIRQRNENRVIILSDEQPLTDENDPYADYKIPDDLTW